MPTIVTSIPRGNMRRRVTGGRFKEGGGGRVPTNIFIRKNLCNTHTTKSSATTGERGVPVRAIGVGG
jgi:hypothetical protein